MRWPVALFVPNLIGYARVALAILGYCYALHDWRVTVGAYVLSQGLDAADGLAARMLGQSSSFGAVLDMVTDRASTGCLCIVLGNLYPELIPRLTALMMLDAFSHWYHMYAALKLDLSSHKACDNALLRFYYWKPALFVTCAGTARARTSCAGVLPRPRPRQLRLMCSPCSAGTEFWYVALYAAKFAEASYYADLVRAATFPVMLFKQLCNVVQMGVAMEKILAHDAEERRKPSAIRLRAGKVA